MRSRTELVTTTLEGSEFEDDTDLEDSEEDWKPQKSNRSPRAPRASHSKSRKRKAPPPKRKSRAAAPKKKWKKKSSSEEENSESEKYSSDDEPIQKLIPMKQPKTEKKLVESMIIRAQGTAANSTVTRIQDIKNHDDDDGDNDGNLDEDEAEKILGIEGTSKVAIKKSDDAEQEDSKNDDNDPIELDNNELPDEEGRIFIQRPLQRKYASIRSTPDRNGNFELLVCKSELKDGIKDNVQICLWRRDGSSLLQKYIRDETEKKDVIFRSSSVYSCWEESKRGDYYDVKVQSYGGAGEVQTDKVKILNVDELETIAETLHTDDEDVEEEIDTKHDIKLNAAAAGDDDEDEDDVSNDAGDEDEHDDDENSIDAADEDD